MVALICAPHWRGGGVLPGPVAISHMNRLCDRSEVRGGSRKPVRQKGSGRARHGSIRAPQWRGGGVVHGPRGPKSYEYTLPKKVKNLGLRAALSIKCAQGDLTIVDALQVALHRVRHVLPILEREKWQSVLMVDGGDVDNNLCYATWNLQKVNIFPSQELNVYEYVTERQGGVEYWSCSIAGAEIVTGLCGLISALCTHQILHILLLVYAI